MSIILYVGISGRHGSVRFIFGHNLKDIFQPKLFCKAMISFIIKSMICFTVWKFHHKHWAEIRTESFQEPVFHAITLILLLFSFTTDTHTE